MFQTPAVAAAAAAAAAAAVPHNSSGPPPLAAADATSIFPALLDAAESLACVEQVHQVVE